jgi:hypothetical protein
MVRLSNSPHAVYNYFMEESKFNSMLGPLMTAPKDRNKRRIIVDLSFSSGQAESVNSTVSKFLYLGMPLQLKLPIIDTLCQVLEQLGN